jgi:hypothetical protein
MAPQIASVRIDLPIESASKTRQDAGHAGSFTAREKYMSIHWRRIVLGALLLEIVLFTVLVPIGYVSTTVFLIAVPIGCFVVGYLVTRWLLRTLLSGLLLHGTLVGVVAPAMYFGLVFMQPDGLSSAIAVYGVPLFWFSQAMRIAGCVTGALHNQRRAELRLQVGSAEKERV